MAENQNICFCLVTKCASNARWNAIFILRKFIAFTLISIFPKLYPLLRYANAFSSFCLFLCHSLSLTNCSWFPSRKTKSDPKLWASRHFFLHRIEWVLKYRRKGQQTFTSTFSVMHIMQCTIFWFNDTLTLKYKHDMAVILNYNDRTNNVAQSQNSHIICMVCICGISCSLCVFVDRVHYVWVKESKCF